MMIMPGGPVQVVPSAPPAGAPQQNAGPAEKKSESAKAQ
jgi:hypothetical protein